MIIDSLVIALGLDPKGVKSGMAQANQAVEGGLGKITGALKSMAAPLLGALGTAKLFGDYLANADDLGDFASKVNESITDIDAWGQAVVLAGGDAASFQSTVTTMTKSLSEVKNLGSGRAKAALDAFGISVTDAEGNVRKATDVLMELAEKAETMDKTEFIGLAQKMGVDTGTANLLSGGRKAASELIDKMKEFSYTEKDAEVAGNFNDQLMLLQKSLQLVASVIFQVVLPPITWLADKLTDLFVLLRQHREFVLAFFAGLGAIIMAKVIPAFAAWFATLLANPLTYVVLALVALAALIEDMIVWVEGGESAFGKLWESLLGSPEEAKHMWKMLKEDLAALGEGAKLLGGFLLKGFSEFADGVGFLKDDIGAVIDTIVAKASEIAEGFGVIKDDIGAVIDAIVAKATEIAEGFGVIKDDIVSLFAAIGGYAQEAVATLVGVFQAGLQAVAGFIDTFIVKPIQAALGLVNKAKNFITGGSDVDVLNGMSHEDAAAKTAELRAQNMAKAAASNANVGSRSADAMAGSAEVTNNVDQSTTTTVGAVNVTVNQASPDATGEAYGAAIQKAAGNSERSQKS